MTEQDQARQQPLAIIGIGCLFPKADHLGTYRETVSAILRDFKRQELVELGYRRINILDSETLKTIAGIWDW